MQTRWQDGKRLFSFDEPVDRLHELVDLPGAFAFADRFAHTRVDVAAHDLQGHLVKRSPRGRELLDDVNAVAALLDHPADPPDLALDAPQARQQIVVLWIL